MSLFSKKGRIFKRERKRVIKSAYELLYFVPVVGID
jgi:hypothetical protein